MLIQAVLHHGLHDMMGKAVEAELGSFRQHFLHQLATKGARVVLQEALTHPRMSLPAAYMLPLGLLGFEIACQGAA